MSYISSERTRTFQGRHIVKMKWKEREIEVVEGLLAYHRTFPIPVESTLVADIFDSGVEEITEIDELGIGTIALDRAADAQTIQNAATQLGEGVSWIEPVVIDHGAITPNDPLFSQQWALKKVRAEVGWDHWIGPSNESKVVDLAILDSGIPMVNGILSHPDLNDPTRFVLGSDLLHKGENPVDDQGHGTHVTGIAAAASNNGLGISGLCWGGTVLIIKAMNSSQPPDASSITFEKGILEAVKFARERESRLVINYSGGGPPDQTRKIAVEYLDQERELLVAAAGNNHGGPLDYPAAYSTNYPNVIAVGAVDRKLKRPSFANRGPQLTVVAPGVDILSCLPNYRVTLNRHGLSTRYDLMDGTSMATPLVSALAVLIWSKWPALTAEEVRDKITQTADPLGSQNDFGHGIINAGAALA